MLNTEFRIEIIPLEKGIRGAREPEVVLEDRLNFFQRGKQRLNNLGKLIGKYAPRLAMAALSVGLVTGAVKGGIQSYNSFAYQQELASQNAELQPIVPTKEIELPSQDQSIPLDTQVIAPTQLPMGRIAGSVLEGNLTSNNQPWEIDINGERQLQQFARNVGSQDSVDIAVLRTYQQRGLNLLVRGELDQEKFPVEYWALHIGNGTASVVGRGIKPEIYQTLANAGVFKKSDS